MRPNGPGPSPRPGQRRNRRNAAEPPRPPAAPPAGPVSRPARPRPSRPGAARDGAAAPVSRGDRAPVVGSRRLRRNWPAVLEAVKRERRVAWILLSNASVLSLEDNVLTLRFARDGDLKGFSTSGCDADLKRVLGAQFGLNVMVKGVTGGEAGGSAAGRAPAIRTVGPPKTRLSPGAPGARWTRVPPPAHRRRRHRRHLRAGGPGPARATARADGPPAAARPGAPRHYDDPAGRDAARRRRTTAPAPAGRNSPGWT